MYGTEPRCIKTISLVRLGVEPTPVLIGELPFDENLAWYEAQATNLFLKQVIQVTDFRNILAGHYWGKGNTMTIATSELTVAV